MSSRARFSTARFAICLVLCWATLPVLATGANDGTVLWYLEQEAGGEPYRVRYLITADFMRSDDGQDQGDFSLLDRRQARIFSVVRETASVLAIDGDGPAPRPPVSLGIAVQESIEEQAPKLEGRQPRKLELRAAGELCRSAVVAPGLLDDARTAFREFARVLAVQQARTLDNTPLEFRTPCFLAVDVYAGDFHLGAGLPLLEWNDRGDRRELLNYQRDVSLAEALFQIPEQLGVFRIPDSGAGAQQPGPAGSDDRP